MPASALTTRLATLTREQLVALFDRLVSRHPDLEDLVHLPLPGEARRADPASVHAHVTRILLHMGDDWRASSRAQCELFPIVEMGDDYRKQGLLDDARVVYRAVIDAILALYPRIRDEESEIGNVVGDCVEGLAACLDATTEPQQRELLLRGGGRAPRAPRAGPPRRRRGGPNGANGAPDRQRPRVCAGRSVR